VESEAHRAIGFFLSVNAAGGVLSSPASIRPFALQVTVGPCTGEIQTLLAGVNPEIAEACSGRGSTSPHRNFSAIDGKFNRTEIFISMYIGEKL
jgi:hypothetical protein